MTCSQTERRIFRFRDYTMTCSQTERLESVGKGLQDLRHVLNELRRSQQDQSAQFEYLFTQMFDRIAADQDSSAVYPDQDALEEEEEVQVAVKSHKTLHLSGSKNLVIFCNSVNSDGFRFEVYVMNLNSDSIFSSNSPEILIPRIQSEFGEKHWVGCVLNSTLYIFEDSGFGYSNGSEVMKFDLSSSNLNSYPADEKIKTNVFTPVTYMKHTKHMPVAVPTPDGKRILVFEALICRHRETSFELYDPSKDAWTEVELPDFYFRRNCIEVLSYFFIDESRFVLATTTGYYVLHLDSEKKNVPLPDLPRLGRVIPHCNVVTIGNRVITAGEASAIGSGSDIVRAFKLSFSRESFHIHHPLPFIALLEHKDGDALTLVSHTQPREFIQMSDVWRTNLLIDVCRTNLDSLNTTLEGTLKYILDPGSYAGMLHLRMFII